MRVVIPTCFLNPGPAEPTFGLFQLSDRCDKDPSKDAGAFK